jgi:ribonucleoside-triphosphate reductase
MGMMLQLGSYTSSEAALRYLIPPRYARAHVCGDIHIHDLDFYPMGTLTCLQIDMRDMMGRGFSTGHGTVAPSEDIFMYTHNACIILQSNQNEMHGGQSIPNFDYLMSAGVKGTFRKHVLRLLTSAAKICGWPSPLIPTLGIDFDDADSYSYSCICSHCYPIGAPDGFDEARYERVISMAMRETEQDTQQAMRDMVTTLNTMHSRAGAQVPFTSINYGTATSLSGRMATRSMLTALHAGMAKGETPLFPISVFKVKSGIYYEAGTPNYDLFLLAMKVSARRLLPNFLFLDQPFNLQYYRPGCPESEVSTMGCRTRVMANAVNGEHSSFRRGNLSFTTINLVRIGMLAALSSDNTRSRWMTYFQLLKNVFDLAVGQLRERMKFQMGRRVKNFPFLMGQRLWYGSENMTSEEDVLGDVIKHGTLSVGFIGLAESLVAMLGKHHGESEAAQERGVQIVRQMSRWCECYTLKLNLNVTLLATPAEGLAGRFTLLDRDLFGLRAHINDRMYYTNSFHVPVYYPTGIYDKLAVEGVYHTLCNAGHITYIELDGNPEHNIEAFEAILRMMFGAGVGYGAINHPVDRDPVCGYTGIIGMECPGCGRMESDGRAKFERIRRITGYLVGTMDKWNEAKKAEEGDRYKHGRL